MRLRHEEKAPRSSEGGEACNRKPQHTRAAAPRTGDHRHASPELDQIMRAAAPIDRDRRDAANRRLAAQNAQNDLNEGPHCRDAQEDKSDGI
jgi:hypothetical protein